MKPQLFFLCAIIVLVTQKSVSQQMADSLFKAPINNPTYKNGEGPVVAIDEAHNNFHTRDGRYQTFTNVLEQDGYNVISFNSKFSEAGLKEVDILVISNPLHKSNLGNWQLPNPSAFTSNEMSILNKWVEAGGSLFLIADHMPFAGAAKDVAATFDYKFLNGFAVDTTKNGGDLFSLGNNAFIDSDILHSEESDLTIDSIMTFTGQAFKIPSNAKPILRIPKHWISYQPKVAWQFDKDVEIKSIGGWFQGAYQNYGRGKLVVFGEAAMFTAQLFKSDSGISKFGMNQPNAKNNARLLLALMHWLD